MIMFVIRYEVPPDMAGAYGEWGGSEIRQAFEGTGIVEFNRLEDWTAWYNTPNTQGLLDDLGALTVNMDMELWGPSPMIPERMRRDP